MAVEGIVVEGITAGSGKTAVIVTAISLKNSRGRREKKQLAIFLCWNIVRVS